jgi:hypothetical protein
VSLPVHRRKIEKFRCLVIDPCTLTIRCLFFPDLCTSVVLLTLCVPGPRSVEGTHALIKFARLEIPPGLFSLSLCFFVIDFCHLQFLLF